MKLTPTKLVAFTAITAFSAAGLFAQAQLSHRHGQGEHRFQHTMAALNLTDAQKAQAKAAFQEARQSSQPIRRQLMETRKSLQAAVEAGNQEQIQQLSATEGNEIGQLTALRSAAFAKVVQTLTPDQKAKLAALEQARQQHHRGPGSHANTKAAS
jgi:Spy/CpxP family protein refolding chaperone